MSRRSSRRPRPNRSATAPAVPSAAAPCPCGLPAPYGDCCGRLHAGAAAATAPEALMRSRYSAFVVRDEAYLLRTWHPSTRPPHIEFDPELRWQGLEILDTGEGSAFHTTGTVTFRARYRHGGEAGALHERSRFARHDGAWVYVDGDIFSD
ncbi:YchJ family protein [Streptomyces sp. URMC 123]|uniref:YchJ family protein n=1 Tax=Streptomyces sp. URMC 123 TaxID=3423403 RepID=UPI003F1CBB30